MYAVVRVMQHHAIACWKHNYVRLYWRSPVMRAQPQVGTAPGNASDLPLPQLRLSAAF